jgi:DNA polymerase-3 subunit gamma/tau
MENFIVSARKYRPETFGSVVGQDSITATLINSIKNNHIGHAYLFCGPRGVGKTTCARIFAKTINCSNLNSNYEPCNECESCISFNEMRAFNIHELDAASNNTVDDIRSLIDKVRIPPQIGRFSIYIIDEVHMLSAQAFNAFLKTLEEPPAHAIFILATTEKHKIIPTILSRCQIFDFNRIRVNDIVKYLEKIAEKESVDYELDALNIIALKADGAMRDALSVFDQMVSYSGKKITYKEVIKNLNVLDYDYYFRITDAFLNGQINDSLLIFSEIINEGFDGHNFIVGLSGHFRDLLVTRDPETMVLLETGETISERYKEQSKRCEPEFLYKALDICSTTDIHYRTSRNQKLHVELALIKLCQITEEKKKTAPVTSPAEEESESPQVRKATSPQVGESASPQVSKSSSPQVPESPNEQGEESASPQEEESSGLQVRESPSKKGEESASPQEEESSGLQVRESPSEKGEESASPQEEESPSPQVRESSSEKVKTETEDEDFEGEVMIDAGEEEKMKMEEEIDEDEDESIEQFDESTEEENQKEFDEKTSPSFGKNISSVYSIREALHGNNTRKNETEDSDGYNDTDKNINDKSFSLKELTRVWNDFAEEIRKARPRMYNTLKSHLPEIQEEYEILLILDNNDQKDEFQKDIKQDILVFLREKLKNNMILINTSVKTDDEQVKLYTSEEKYEHMLKKNPDLGKLKQDFNLDFE